MTVAALAGLVAEVTGDGMPVVMIPGLGGTLNMFEGQMAALSGYRAVRLDLPGAGRAPRPHGALSIEGLAEAVVRACAGLGVGRAHFVGHSMGTILAQVIAVKEPQLVASLALFGALAEPAEATREGLAKRAALARSGGLSDIADTIAQNALSAHTRETNPAVVAFVRESITRQDAEGYALHCEALARARAVDAARIRAPALFVTGEADAVNPPGVAQALADRIKDAVFSALPRVGHWATVEAPRECNARLMDFWKRAER